MANINADVLRVCNTEASLLTTLREKQFGLATDTGRGVFKAPGGAFWYYEAKGEDAAYADITSSTGVFKYDADNKIEITSTYAFIMSGGDKILDYLQANGYMSLNADGADIDIELWGVDASDPAIHVDAADNNVGINTLLPRRTLQITKAPGDSGTNVQIGEMTNNSAKVARILSTQYADTAEPEGFIMLRSSSPDANNNVVSIGGGSSTFNAATGLDFYTGATATTATGVLRMSIDKDGNLIINDTGAAVDVRIEGDADANLVTVDGSTDKVGFGVANPAEKVDVNGKVKCTDVLFVGGIYDGETAQNAIDNALSTAQSAVGDAATATGIATDAAARADAGLIRGSLSTTSTDAIFTPVKKQLTDGSAVSLFEVALPNSGDTCGGMFSYRIHCWNGTDFQSHCGVANYTAGNKAGTITSAIGHSSGVGGLETEIESSGTLTDAFAIVNGTGKITITLNANTSLTPSANQFYIVYTLHNDSDQAVTIL